MLNWRTKAGFGFGHLGNDLVATMWFSYLLIFFNQVIKLDPVKSGLLLLIGQLTDGLATPFVGQVIDKVSPFKSFNGKKFWHIVGQALVLISFVFIFFAPTGYNPNQTQEGWTKTEVFGFYIPFIVIFQVAWATVQISHLSMTGDLGHTDSERVLLNSIRNAFTVIASCVVHVAAMFLLQPQAAVEDKQLLVANTNVDREHLYIAEEDHLNLANKTIKNDHLGWEDRNTFRDLAIGSVGLGLLASIFFHLTIQSKDFSSQEKDEQIRESSSWRGWFKQAPFYSITALYCLVRLAVNMVATYLPFYLQETLELEKQYISIIPLVQFIAGFAVSFAMKPLSKFIGKAATFGIGCLLLMAGNAIIAFSPEISLPLLYTLAVFLGAGTSTILIQTLAITAELIATNESTSGFVYGFISFIEKISSGGVIMAVQFVLDRLQNCEEHGKYMPAFYELIVGYGIGGITMLALLMGALHTGLTSRRTYSHK